MRTMDLVWMLGSGLALSVQPSKGEPCHPEPIQLMVLGDSHMVGYWGEAFHRNLHLTGRFNVFNVAIGGAGSMHFVQRPLKNHCCGYKIRRTWADDVFLADEPIRQIEFSSIGNQQRIGAAWGFRLDSMVAYWKPDVVVVALGNNRVDAHEALVSLLRYNAPKASIVWISPFKRMGFYPRLRAIQGCLKGVERSFLVRMDDLAGHDTLLTFHLGAYQAKLVAKKAAKRVLPLLLNPILPLSELEEPEFVEPGGVDFPRN